MKNWTADVLRQEFLKFFESKNHTFLPSASLIPHGDTTLLLTGAGMVPFKPFFLGQEKPESRRVVTFQRCMRTVDIDNVGQTDRHGTFFEMLGNFSFGDYFKEEVIGWAWEFVLEHLEFPREKLWVTIFEDDDEAHDIWHDTIGFPQDRIVRLGREDNFWEIGVGPCGPCSEIHLDRGPEYGCTDPGCKPGCDCDRYLEFWNLVFIQFYKDENGSLTPLTSKGIDTGMGLERVTALMQDAKSIFDIDNIRPVVDRVAALAKTEYGRDEDADVSLRVITDHLRGITFMVFDGVLPSNEGRGYILRRLLRRAVRHGRLLGIHDAFLLDMVDEVIEQMKSGYPELLDKRSYIHKVVGLEEERFQATLDQGIGLLQEVIQKAKRAGNREIAGVDVFKLYDTFGFPYELTKEIADEEGFSLDEEGFRAAMEAQRQRARAARGDSSYAGENMEVFQEAAAAGDVRFVGYDRSQVSTRIRAIIKDGSLVGRAEAGDSVSLVVDETPFYAEAGGQVSDRGRIQSGTGTLDVDDVRRPFEGLIVHTGRVTAGELEADQAATAVLENELRRHTARHHTATHLLHQALRGLLGDHVNQAGSFVSPERLRFDFTHFEALTSEQLTAIESEVNDVIMSNRPVEASEMSMDQAKAAGAVALFGEKYGNRVRVVTVTDYSKELCGGTHVSATGDIGLFRIVSEGSVASGVRRIEAVCGRRALDFTREREGVLRQVSRQLQSTVEDLPEQAAKLIAQQKELNQQVQQFRQKLAGDAADQLIRSAASVDGVAIVAAPVEVSGMDELRALGDRVRDRLKPSVIVLGASAGDKVLLLAMASEDIAGKRVHAGDIVKRAAQICGGGGGGRPDMAQAGGWHPEKLQEALQTVKSILEEQLQGNVK